MSTIDNSTLKNVAYILGLPEELSFTGKRIKFQSEDIIDQQIEIDIPNDDVSFTLLITYLWLQHAQQMTAHRKELK